MKSFFKFLKSIFKKNETKPEVIKPKEPVNEIPTENEQYFIDIKINESALPMLKLACDKILKNKEKYMAVQEATGVPWDVVAACHYRESDLDFRGVLHNGEYIIGTGRLTKLVPKNRGPFNTWQEAAIDAMMIEKSKFPKKWDAEGKLDFCEKYNGLGYRKKGVPSPYVYASTNKYTSGLYVADGKYNPVKVDKRLGCACIIKRLGEIDGQLL